MGRVFIFVLMLALLPLTALWDGVTTLTAVCHTIHRCYSISIRSSMLRLYGTAFGRAVALKSISCFSLCVQCPGPAVAACGAQ